MVGFSVSLTVTVKLQLAVLPAASVTTKVLVVVPTGNALPEARPAVCEMVCPVQLSELVGGVKVTTAEQRPGSLLTVIFPGQLEITGSSLSITVTSKLQESVCPFKSSATTSTVDVPTGKSYGNVIGVPPIL